jgi:membrane protease subunit HflC
MKRIIWLPLGLATLLYGIATSIVAVKESEIVVISEFGRPVKVVADAGATFKLPDPIQTVRRLDKRLQHFQVLPTEYGTLDRRNVVAEVFVVWKITDPMKYLASVRNSTTAELRLETLANAELGAAIGRNSLDNIFTTDSNASQVDAIFSSVTSTASNIAQRELGIEIVSIRAKRLGFPQQNLLAIYKRMESEWDKLAKQFRAEGQEEATKIRAETDLEVRNLKASAEREAQILLGNSEAEAARLYADSFTQNAEFYQFTRSLESYKTIFNQQSKIILSSDNPIFDALLHPPKPVAEADNE